MNIVELLTIPEQTSEVSLRRNKCFKYPLTERQQVGWKDVNSSPHLWARCVQSFKNKHVRLTEETAEVGKRGKKKTNPKQTLKMDETKVIRTTTGMK